MKWHQDFTFDPHSNDDSLTILVFVDDVTANNGALKLVPGSHHGALHSLRQNGVFTGAVCAQQAALFEQSAVSCTGKAGSVCLMHSRVAHASGTNQTDQPRTLLIYNLTAADAIPLFANAVPSTHAGMLVSGREPGMIRSMAFSLQMPELPTGASFFEQQSTSVEPE